VPKRNRAFWIAKFEGNTRRDAAAMAALRALQYTTIVVWECELDDEQGLRQKLSMLPPLA
jgi:DNA mismatch endonuclease (patch repair protein)